jgi:dolichol-phosphate mannosyltransferase
MKTCIIIPTYNEAENIEYLIKEILKLNIFGLMIAVVDDDSPDGTGQIADRLAKEDPRIKVLHRFKDRGRGRAGIEGFKFALAEGADFILEMDADLSHQPRYIPLMLEHSREYDIVLGSRFVEGGKDVERGLIRQMTTRLARAFINMTLGLGIKDPTSGFRCFRRKVLESIEPDTLVSTGPSILEEILYKAVRKGFSVYEMPIAFEDRKKGETKLNLPTLLKTLYMVYRFRSINR